MHYATAADLATAATLDQSGAHRRLTEIGATQIQNFDQSGEEGLLIEDVTRNEDGSIDITVWIGNISADDMAGFVLNPQTHVAWYTIG